MISRTMWGYIRSLYEQALSLMKEPGTVPEAIEKLRLIVKVQPDFLEATYALGYAHFQMGEHQEAISAWELTLEAHTRNAKVCFGLAYAHLREGDYESSKMYAEMARDGGYPEDRLLKLLDELERLTFPVDMYEDGTILPIFDPA